MREATHKQTGDRFAIKCIRRQGLTQEDVEALTAEVQILREMRHDNIMQLYDFFTEVCNSIYEHCRQCRS